MPSSTAGLLISAVPLAGVGVAILLGRAVKFAWYNWVGIAVEARPQPSADAWWSPIETVSNSESGFERVYQGSTLLLSWPARIEPGETRRFAVSQRVAVARDHALEEPARS